MFANLPFLKKRGPKMAPSPETKMYEKGGEVNEYEDHRQIALGLAQEMMQAMHAADHEKFHSAMEAYLEHMENKPESGEETNVEP